jgi:hypothetical protein
MNRNVPTLSHHLGQCGESTLSGLAARHKSAGRGFAAGGTRVSALPVSAAMTEYANTAARRLIRRVRVPTHRAIVVCTSTVSPL